MILVNKIYFIFIILYLFKSSSGAFIPELNVAREIVKNAKPSEIINVEKHTPNPSFIEPAYNYATQKPASSGEDIEENNNTVKHTSARSNTEPDVKQTTLSTTVKPTLEFISEPTKISPSTPSTTTTATTTTKPTDKPVKSSTEQPVKSSTEQPVQSSSESTINKSTTNKQRTEKPHKHHNKQNDDLPIVFPVDITKDLINKEINKIKKILNNSDFFININAYSNGANKYNNFKPFFCKYKPMYECNKYTSEGKIYICKKGMYFNTKTCNCDLKENIRYCENGLRIYESIETMDENSKEELDSNEVELFNYKTFVLDFFNIFKHIFD